MKELSYVSGYKSFLTNCSLVHECTYYIAFWHQSLEVKCAFHWREVKSGEINVFNILRAGMYIVGLKTFRVASSSSPRFLEWIIAPGSFSPSIANFINVLQYVAAIIITGHWMIELKRTWHIQIFIQLLQQQSRWLEIIVGTIDFYRNVAHFCSNSKEFAFIEQQSATKRQENIFSGDKGKTLMKTVFCFSAKSRDLAQPSYECLK